MTTPQVLGERYEIGGVLGRGGMAEVHRGRDLRLGREVAVKVLRSDLARDPSFQVRFRREAQAAASLNHPAIVAVYDTGEDRTSSGATPYIVMEYVEGETLRDVLRREGRLDPTRAMQLTADICGALDFSHRNGIVHRDVKPGNVMITPQGTVKVMDFGIARAVSDSAATMTSTAAVIGTAQYLSPEQARGEAVDARSDVYAAGCVLYELLTGEPPFTGDSPVAVAYQHVREDPKSPSEVNPAVPPQLDAVVLKALSKNPANRYQSAAEMRSDLVRVRSGQAPLAPAVMSADERTAMMTSGPPTGSTRRLNGRGMPPPPPPAYDDYYADEEPPRRTGRVVAIVVGVLVVLGLVGFVAYQLLSGPATPSQVAVPGVVGQTQQDASNQLIAAGLRVGNVVQQESAVEQVGKVLNTNPAAGAQVAERSNVDLTVGSGPAFVNVPALQGMSVADATALLKSQGLVLGKQTNAPTNDPTQVGKVVNSSPGPGVRVKGGSTVDIAVGVQQTALTVPDVTGQDKDDAKKALEAKGFEVDTNTVDGGGQKDTVLSTDPPAGTQAQPGSKVTMNVSKGNQPSAVPTVLGQTASQAKQILKAAGFTNVSTQTVDAGGQFAGRVVQQSPQGGSTADPDQEITLVVGKGSSNGAGDGLGLLDGVN